MELPAHSWKDYEGLSQAIHTDPDLLRESGAESLIQYTLLQTHSHRCCSETMLILFPCTSARWPRIICVKVSRAIEQHVASRTNQGKNQAVHADPRPGKWFCHSLLGRLMRHTAVQLPHFCATRLVNKCDRNRSGGPNRHSMFHVFSRTKWTSRPFRRGPARGWENAASDIQRETS